MKLSTKGRYGLRAMIDLALYSEQEPVSIQSIALRQNMSERYLEQLMASLKKAGLVTSIRGAAGGYHHRRRRGISLRTHRYAARQGQGLCRGVAVI